MLDNVMSIQTTTHNEISTRLSPYTKFTMALKSKEVQRQYPNLLGRFLDFCRFEGLTVEEKSLKFYQFVKSSSPEVLEDLVIKFVISQKDRIDKREITAGTLRNYVKAIKLFSRMNRITMNWDLIASSLPKAKQLVMIAYQLKKKSKNSSNILIVESSSSFLYPCPPA
jgi:hypothetical protein